MTWQKLLQGMHSELQSFRRCFERDNIDENRFERPMGTGARVWVTDRQWERVNTLLNEVSKLGTMPGEWVSVTDYLPFPVTKVQVFCVSCRDENVTCQRVAWMDRGMWWDSASSVIAFQNPQSNTIWNITHWSPLADDPIR